MVFLKVAFSNEGFFFQMKGFFFQMKGVKERVFIERVLSILKGLVTIETLDWCD